MNYYIIFYQYLSIKKNPKFQFWLSGEKEIIIDHNLSKQVAVDRDAYTKKLLTARTLISGDNLEKISKNMSKYFIDFSIYYSEPITILDIDNFNHLQFPNFTNNTNV